MHYYDFSTYNIQQPVSIGLNMGNLNTILKMSKKNDSIALKHPKDTDALELKISGSKKKIDFNLKLMDIGHFAINEADGDVVLQTSVDLSADNFDREQMLSTIKRIVRQGLEFFNLLKEIINGDQCPFYMLHNYIEEMREKQVKDQKTIH